ncbi:MAG: branched-chain amino acid ABC transporter permease [Candidatus Odinarchaeota archaeon]
MLKVVKGNLTKILPVVIIIVVLMLTPFFAGIYYLAILRSLILWSALAMSWWFFSGITKYVSLGSAAFFGISLYFVAIFGRIVPFPLLVLFAGLFCFVIALGIGLVTLRVKGIYFAVFTFGLAELFRNLVLWYLITIIGTRFIFLPYIPTQLIYWAVLIVTIIVIGLIFFLLRTKIGLALRMIGENEEAAAHLGVNVNLYKTLGFAISSMLMGLVAASYAPRFSSLDPSIAFNSQYSLLPAIMAMLGGIAFLFGPILGAVTITLLNEFLRTFATEYFLILLGLIVIFIVLFMPDGIAGVLEKVRAIIKQEGMAGLIERVKNGIAGFIERVKNGIAGFIERVKNVFGLDRNKEPFKAPETPP